MTIDDVVRAPPRRARPRVEALVDRVRATRLGQLDMALAAGPARAGRVPPRLATPSRVARLVRPTLVAGSLDEWLAPYLGHAVGAADLERLDVAMLLSNQLSWDQQTELGRAAPRPPGHAAPAGRLAIDYSRDTPTASVRVQDLFGTHRAPDRRPRRGPASRSNCSRRPIAPSRSRATCPGSGRASWAEVRKEMAGRYPKHQWPDDPAAAPPKRLKDR